ncbi:laminin G domain protein [Ostertagia ostertagi]
MGYSGGNRSGPDRSRTTSWSSISERGRVNVAVNLGNDTLKSVTTNFAVVNGKWHRVAVERREHRTTVIIDDKVTTIISSPNASHLNTNGLVYLGEKASSIYGIRPKHHPLSSRFKGTFVGCIRRLRIRGATIDLLHDVISSTSPPTPVLTCPTSAFRYDPKTDLVSMLERLAASKEEKMNHG